MDRQQGFVNDVLNRAVQHCIRLWTVDSQGPRKAQLGLADEAALPRPRVANQLEVCARLPALASEPPAPSLCGNCGVGPCIGIRKHGIAILVQGYWLAGGCGR